MTHVGVQVVFEMFVFYTSGFRRASLVKRDFKYWKKFIVDQEHGIAVAANHELHLFVGDYLH